MRKMQRKNKSIGNKGNDLGNSFGTRTTGMEYEWYNVDRRKPMVGYVLDEDGNYPENWRWF